MKQAQAQVVGMVRRDGPITSILAAQTASRRKLTIRARVETFARFRPHGFTDSDLFAFARDLHVALGQPEPPESSYRKRRTELAEENYIIAEGGIQKNEHKQDVTVWIHRDHMLNPPPIKPKEAKPTRFALLQEENARLRAALESAIKVADEAREEWDAAPSGMKAGKLLIALSGHLPKYRADIDAIHAARIK